jgi:hypothetical protein
MTRNEVWQEVQRLADTSNNAALLPIERSAAFIAYEQLTAAIYSLLPDGEDPDGWLIRDVVYGYWPETGAPLRAAWRSRNWRSHRGLGSTNAGGNSAATA